MAGVADYKEEYQTQSWERLKASIRTRISVWIGLAAFVGWMISRILPKKQRAYVPDRIRQANHRSEEMRPARKSEQPRDQGGLLSLMLELLGAVAIRLVQRYFKSWRSTLIVKLHNPPAPVRGIAVFDDDAFSKIEGMVLSDRRWEHGMPVNC
jgi:hypothetical protein